MANHVSAYLAIRAPTETLHVAHMCRYGRVLMRGDGAHEISAASDLVVCKRAFCVEGAKEFFAAW